MLVNRAESHKSAARFVGQFLIKEEIQLLSRMFIFVLSHEWLIRHRYHLKNLYYR